MMPNEFKKYFVWLVIFIAAPLVLISFQNCAPVHFSGVAEGGGGPITDPEDPNPDPKGVFNLLDQRVQTAYNTPISWNASYTGLRVDQTISLDVTSGKNSLTIQDVGQIQILDAALFKINFIPSIYFRGETQIWLFAHNANKKQVSQAKVTLAVGTNLNLHQPALAMRAGGCITCHAEVHANVITDFGYQSPYYFGQNVSSSFAWNDGTAYGDHEAFFTYPDGSQGIGSWTRLKLFDGYSISNPGKIYIPQAELPKGPQSAIGGGSKLKDYVSHRLSHSTYPASQSAQIIEKKSIYIGAPTKARLLEAFAWSNSDQSKGYKFISDPNGWALSGLNTSYQRPSQNLFKNDTSVVVCEGDLLIDGGLLLNSAKIKTRTGCRLYVTGNVYIYGTIDLVTDSQNDFSLKNIQISSSQAILMGLGSLWKQGSHCEQGQMDSGYWGYYAQRDYWTQGLSPEQKQAYDQGIADSAKYRLSYYWGIPNYNTRNGGDPKAYSEMIYSQMQAQIGQRYDSACEPEKRNVGYQRIILNAPVLHSRYAGVIRGSVIAEFPLMPLGLGDNQSRFRFEFDPVFEKVNVFPMLKEQDFLKVQN